MNCISAYTHWLKNQKEFVLSRSPSYLTGLASVLMIVACDLSAPNAEAQVEVNAAPHTPITTAQAALQASAQLRTYDISYIVTPVPERGGALVELKLEQDSDLLRELDIHAPAEQFENFEGDGEIRHESSRVVWVPPAAGGSLRWFASVDHKRNESSYDAYITEDWALFRAEDVIPRVASRAQKDASSNTTLSFQLPKGWSSVTEYFGRNNQYPIVVPERRFDRPAGWILLGKIGVRRERIADVRVTVAAPVGHGLRRLDILALMNWTIPEFVRLFPQFPPRLTIVGAAEPMWRGGLSGPGSLYIHADRPLLSENATSTIVHEVFHVALGLRSESGADWIVEGLAEYYSLKILFNSGTINASRFQSSLDKLADWGSESNFLCAESSSGASTARAVSIFSSLDNEIESSSDGNFSLDDVIRALADSAEAITIVRLQQLTAEYIGADSAVLAIENLPGCEI